MIRHTNDEYGACEKSHAPFCYFPKSAPKKAEAKSARYSARVLAWKDSPSFIIIETIRIIIENNKATNSEFKSSRCSLAFATPNEPIKTLIAVTQKTMVLTVRSVSKLLYTNNAPKNSVIITSIKENVVPFIMLLKFIKNHHKTFLTDI